MGDKVTAYIGMGSNLADPIQQINSARQDINALAAVQELAFSRLYRTKPVGPQDQPDFINAVMAIATTLPALELLQQLQAIEQAHGRERKEHWGARTLDLDVLLYGDDVITSPELTVPHPEIANRAFVLVPLRDCTPDLQIPGLGALVDLLANVPHNDIIAIENQ